MKLRKALIYVLIFPLTLFLDLIIFTLANNCSSCHSFSQFLRTDYAISFPLVSGFLDFLSRHINNITTKIKR